MNEDYDGLDDMSEDDRYQQDHRMARMTFAVVNGYADGTMEQGENLHPLGTILRIEDEGIVIPGHTYLTAVGHADAIMVSDTVKDHASWPNPE